jgi:transcriptional regulator with XRE-family HTH domain
MASDAAVQLAKQLRLLRTSRSITQAELAAVMDVSVPLISSWENAKKPVTPPVDRLKSYAEIFASSRSADERRWRPIEPGNLTAEEKARCRSLEGELRALRVEATDELVEAPQPDGPIAVGSWAFRDRLDINIVCARLPEKLRVKMPYADPADPDYVRLLNYADLDSLLELHGHIRATNPEAEVRFKVSEDMVEDDYTGHLVLLGGVDWNAATRELLAELHLPIRPISSYESSGDAGFEVLGKDGTTRFTPQLDKDVDDGNPLLQDVAQFVRGPNPFNPRRTVTICNGVYGQGTYGAVRALTDVRFRRENGEYVRTHFPAGATYSLLFRVGIRQSVGLTPDWSTAGTVLHEWSDPHPRSPGGVGGYAQ